MKMKRGKTPHIPLDETKSIAAKVEQVIITEINLIANNKEMLASNVPVLIITISNPAQPDNTDLHCHMAISLKDAQSLAQAIENELRDYTTYRHTSN